VTSIKNVMIKMLLIVKKNLTISRVINH